MSAGSTVERTDVAECLAHFGVGDDDRRDERCAISTSNEQLEQIVKWLEMIEVWNAACGLTSIKTARERIDKLVLDSLCVLPFLRGKRVLDIGSGGGAPGIPLAIFAPHNNYTLIDAVMKKAQFLNRCVSDLRLSGVRALHTRVGSLKEDAFDTIVARGVGAASRLLQASAHLAGSATRWIFFKPASAPEEKLPARDGWDIQYVHAPCARMTLSLMIVERSQNRANGHRNG